MLQGVPVSLGVDWHATGSDTLFDELRVASQLNRDQFGGVIATADWVTMITLHPAQALALDTFIGTLAVGKKADLTVLNAQHDDPHESLLRTHLPDVAMVWVGGDLLYADGGILEQLKPGQCEAVQVQGSQKPLCVVDTKDPVPKSGQTLDDIRTVLQTHYSDLAPLVPSP